MTVCLLQHVRTHKMWHCNGESLSCSNARSQDGKGNFLRKLELFFMDAVLSVIFLTASRQIDHNDDSSCSNSRLLSNARRRAKNASQLHRRFIYSSQVPTTHIPMRFEISQRQVVDINRRRAGNFAGSVCYLDEN